MKKLLLLLSMVVAFSTGLMAQTLVKGTVVQRSDGEPLVGAIVHARGTNVATSTDVDGNFEIKVPAGVKKLTFSYVGMRTIEMDVAPNMKVEMDPTHDNLDEVVVVAYGTANKESLTGSVAVVNSKEIEKRPVGTVTAALEGNAPGVQVSSNTGQPGSSPAILIRGINTVNGTTAPIYVVDGVIYNGDLASINPADVESMSVLKDAASCALYGAKGANGVILITTKQAKRTGKIDVTVQVREGAYTRGLPFYDTMGANDWLETRWAAQVNEVMVNNPDWTRDQANQWYLQQQSGNNGEQMYNTFRMFNTYMKPADQVMGANGKVLPGVAPYSGYSDTDWWKGMSQTGFRQEYNVNGTAATEKFNVFASLGYMKEDGYIINSYFDRYNARLNANFNPVSYFRFGVNSMITYESSNTPGVDSENLGVVSNPFNNVYLAPFYPYYQHDEYGNIMYDANGDPIYNTSESFTPTQYNVIYAKIVDKDYHNRLTGDVSAYGTVVIPYGFELTVRGNMFRYKDDYKSFSSPLIGSAKGFGRLYVYSYDMNTHNFMQTLTWNHDYGLNHVDVLLDHENYSYDYGYSYQSAEGQIFPGVYEISNFEEHANSGASRTQRRTESYLGRVRYNYDQKYFGEASIRRDGSSRFAKNNRWGTFWSVGASWVVSKEKFMENLPWVDYLKLRAAYGEVGSDAAAGSYAYYDLYTLSSNRYDGQYVYIYPSQIADQKLKWESTKTLDVALEGNLFNDRFNFSIGYFLKKNANLLYNVRVPVSAGQAWGGALNSVTRNMGTMQNWGWELAFGVDIIRNNNFLWNFKVDATFIKNKITALPNGEDQWTSNFALIKGRSRYEYYIPIWAGVDQMTGRSLYKIDPTTHEFNTAGESGHEFDEDLWNTRIQSAEKAGALVKIGDDYYTTQTNYASKDFAGTTLPTVYGSFGTNLSWKGFNLGMLFTYSLGGKLWDSTYASLMSTSLGTSADGFHKDLLKAWKEIPAGMTEDSPNRIDPNGIPQVNALYSQYDNASSSHWLTDASFLTFKNLTFSYDFPKKWMNAIKLEGLNLGFMMDNVFTATKRKGINPMYNYSGGQGNYFVQSRVYTFQLTVNL